MSLMLDTHSAGACVLICHKCCPCCVGISDDLSWTANIFNPCQVSYDMTAIWSLVNIFRVHIFIHFIVSHAYAHERNTGKCISVEIIPTTLFLWTGCVCVLCAWWHTTALIIMKWMIILLILLSLNWCLRLLLLSMYLYNPKKNPDLHHTNWTMRRLIHVK